MMKVLCYSTGEEIKSGDEVLVHGEHGIVDFVIGSETGDPSKDFILREHPQGGVMINASSFGAMFLSAGSVEERLQFVSRGKE